MTILAIDCSAVCASVAILKDDKLMCEYFLNNSLTHSQTLLPMIDSALKICSKNLCDIDEIAISCGPGSFTGLRIGLATVKGLCANRSIFCSAVPTLLALAHNISQDCIVCACMDARRNQVYNALFKVSNTVVTRICEDRAIDAKQLVNQLEAYNEKIILVGDGAEIIKACTDACNIELAAEKDRYVRAGSVAFASKKSYNDIVRTQSSQLEAIYLRKSQAERERENI